MSKRRRFGTGINTSALTETNQRRGLVADGRDMGTVVFPDAPVKIFLDASAEARAERRYNQLKNKGLSVKFPTLLEQIQERDARDRERAVAPLRPAEDALIIDSSEMSIDAVVATVIEHILRTTG